jgi:hypothetical protein
MHVPFVVRCRHGRAFWGSPSLAVSKIRMEFCEDGVDGVRSLISSFVPNRVDKKYLFKTETYWYAQILGEPNIASKIGDPLIS